jgi:6-phosphofructokinase
MASPLSFRFVLEAVRRCLSIENDISVPLTTRIVTLRPAHVNRANLTVNLSLPAKIPSSTNRGDPFTFARGDGRTTKEVDRSGELNRTFSQEQAARAHCRPGETAASAFQKMELCVIGVPKTIGNDLDSTTLTFGFNTAVFAADCVDPAP